MLKISRKCCVTYPVLLKQAFIILTRSKYHKNIYMHFFYYFEK